MENNIIITVSISKSGLPCVWESGGGYTSTGNSIIVCNRHGDAKKPIYIPRCYACGQHALIPVRVGDHIIKTSRHQEDYEIGIYTITTIDKETKEATITLINKYDMGEWDSPLSESLQQAVEAAKRKARCYHCREPHYIKEE